jgi:acetyl-CoA C-acetyltransferase
MNGLTILDHDELIRPQTTAADLARLAPAFAAPGEWGQDELLKLRYPQIESVAHVHTAGNSSGIVDGAALVLIGNGRVGRELGLRARARIVQTALVGSEPMIMLEGPAPATRKALAKSALAVDDIDLFELNEAFAAVVLRYQRLLGIPDERINVNGGAIAMGHPVGATGAMILGTLLDELERRELRRGLCTLCAGGGIGIATIIERV